MGDLEQEKNVTGGTLRPRDMPRIRVKRPGAIDARRSGGKGDVPVCCLGSSFRSAHAGQAGLISKLIRRRDRSTDDSPPNFFLP